MVQKKGLSREPDRSEMTKVKFFNLRPKSNDKNHNLKVMSLVVTYHPLLKSLR